MLFISSFIRLIFDINNHKQTLFVLFINIIVCELIYSINTVLRSNIIYIYTIFYDIYTGKNIVHSTIHFPTNKIYFQSIVKSSRHNHIRPFPSTFQPIPHAHSKSHTYSSPSSIPSPSIMPISNPSLPPFFYDNKCSPISVYCILIS